MKKISDDHALVLHQRALEAAGALVDSEIRHENGEIDDYFYTTFKRYFYIRTHLDKLTALTNIDFQVSQNDTHLKTYILAAKKALPPEHVHTMGALHKLMVDGGFFVYAFRFNDYQPIGVAAHYDTPQGWVNVSGVIKDLAGQGYEPTLEKAKSILETLPSIDNFTYF